MPYILGNWKMHLDFEAGLALAQAIAQVVKALPRKLRDPFLLAASGDHHYEEIAVMLAIPVGTVKWRISESRRMIRMKLDRMGYGDPR